MITSNVPDVIRQEIERMGLEHILTDTVLQRLSRYLDRLLDANKSVNLTAVRNRDLAWRRLILDSLTMLAQLKDAHAGTKLIDVGSGGGIPGIPLALAMPNLHVTLLETTRKKAHFLNTCIPHLELSHTQVINERAEMIGHDPIHRGKYDVAVSRAVGSIRCVLEYTLPLVPIGGQVLLIKGMDIQQELDDAANAMAILGGGSLRVDNAYPPSFECQTLIVSLTKQRSTPSTYPRRSGIPKQTPL